MGNQQGHSVQYKKLYSVLCGSMGGRGTGQRMDTCVLLTPSLFTRNCHNLVNRLCVCVLVALSRPTLCDPMDCSLPGSFVHGDSPGKNTGVGFHAFLQGIFQTQGVNSGLLPCRQILCRYEPAILQYEIKSKKKKKGYLPHRAAWGGL